MPEHDRGARKRGHKDHQVCRQVEDAVRWFLADVDDPVLAGLTVVQVVPAPSAARVLVTLVPCAGEVDAADAMERLAAVRDELREDVAAEVHRRRVPELGFRIARRDDWTEVV
jgi:ribosome-binding factor A